MILRHVLLYGLLLAFSVSCTTTIRPPAVTADPATVYLLQHGRSSSLVLTTGDGDASRWAYGDWRFYALGRKAPADALAAILWPTTAALGRQLIESAPDEPAKLLARMGIGIDGMLPIIVEREAVTRLAARLEGLFQLNLDTLIFNPGPQLEFVHHPQRYTLVNSSNRKVAEWLRELGCELSGISLLSRWEVEDTTSRPERLRTPSGQM